MIAVDSSVWIDFFRDFETPHVQVLERRLRDRRVAVADLVLAEVLQGFTSDASFDRALKVLSLAQPLTVCDATVAVLGARNYRTLRALGITPRKTIDTLIATRCILDRIPLLYSDRDFDPFVEHLGLISALDASGVN